MKNRLIKTLFALFVGVYLLNGIGIPVYYHYCCGELESVSALIKSTSCCGEEEEDEADSDCCQNETKIVCQKSENTFYNNDYKFFPAFCGIFFPKNEISNYNFIQPEKEKSICGKFEFPPGNGRSILCRKSVLIV